MRNLMIATCLFCASASAQEMPGMSHAQAASPADAAYDAAMTKMMADMKQADTGNPDADFVAGMIPHHQGAIDMASVELKYGKDPALRRLAMGIIAAQRKEIAFMQAWRAKHAAP
jgi:uncharacterized protein (DUF305 family)